MSRISLQEASEIARRASERRAVVHGTGPTVDNMAQALGLPPAQVQALLSEIRGEPADVSLGGNRTEMRRALVGLGIAVGLALICVIWSLVAGMRQGAALASVPSATSPVAGSVALDARAKAAAPTLMDPNKPSVSRREYATAVPVQPKWRDKVAVYEPSHDNRDPRLMAVQPRRDGTEMATAVSQD